MKKPAPETPVLPLRDQLVETLYRFRVQGAAATIEGWAGEEGSPLLCQVLRDESEQFVDALLPQIEYRVRRGHAEILDWAAENFPGGIGWEKDTTVRCWLSASAKGYARRAEEVLTPAPEPAVLKAADRQAWIDSVYATVGENIRAQRTAGGAYSQKWLGEQVGLTRSSISNLEAGRQRIPLHVLFLVGAALGTSPIQFLEGIARCEG